VRELQSEYTSFHDQGFLFVDISVCRRLSSECTKSGLEIFEARMMDRPALLNCFCLLTEKIIN